MVTRRDRLLAQLGITQWGLRNPAVLQGELAVHLPDTTRLLIITNDQIDLTNSLLIDIFTAMGLDKSSVYCITSDNIAMLPEQVKCPCWLLGVDITLSWQGISLRSPALNDLYCDGKAKRSLWRQISQHEQHFSINSR
ncbi:DNA polymerase III subunit psi [Photorhabdus temperata subsp. temperata]|uniref:DNA polymerase III subunit psi n=2 Tax=Photorhabdus temperata TaxID=574560 RepID=A0A081RRX0_PHOTE|nr:DNA polymerase III subunit psi [Photorhabdus temperata]ERT11099.1 DNA polymerase III subunit psi [Photorhabdus temperata J3]KER01423.1 DNA polymerase III, psi subunit [Photorhabdus temperata subsp. temperata Meg1]